MTTHTDLIARLRVIANAIADGNYSELTMRIPAEPDRDADIVVMRSADALESLEQQRDELANALNSTLEIVTTDRCDGDSAFASGVNAACERHAIGIRNIIEGVKK